MESSPEWIRYMQSKVGDSYVINQGYMGVILQKDETSARASKQMGKEINKMPICKIKYVVYLSEIIYLFISCVT